MTSAGPCDLVIVAARACVRLWIQHLQSQGDCWESLVGGDLAPVHIEESPGDLRPIRQEIGEVSGSFGSFGHFRGRRRNQYTVEDRRGMAKRYGRNGYRT